jgi:hypothetical protein
MTALTLLEQVSLAAVLNTAFMGPAPVSKRLRIRLHSWEGG